jgi:hypothetical protein
MGNFWTSFARVIAGCRNRLGRIVRSGDVLPPPPPAEINGKQAGLSSDEYCPCRQVCSAAPAVRPTCRMPQPSSVRPNVPLRAGGCGPSDGNHAQAADSDALRSSQPPSWLRAATNGVSGKWFPLSKKCILDEGQCKADVCGCGSFPKTSATRMTQAPPAPSSSHPLLAGSAETGAET